MSIPAEVRRIVQAFLSERPEDNARLRRLGCAEWHDAHERLLVHVYQRMRKVTSEDWREWVKVQDQVRAEVNRLVDQLRQQ